MGLVQRNQWYIISWFDCFCQKIEGKFYGKYLFSDYNHLIPRVYSCSPNPNIILISATELLCSLLRHEWRIWWVLFIIFVTVVSPGTSRKIHSLLPKLQLGYRTNRICCRTCVRSCPPPNPRLCWHYTCLQYSSPEPIDYAGTTRVHSTPPSNPQTMLALPVSTVLLPQTPRLCWHYPCSQYS